VTEVPGLLRGPRSVRVRGDPEDVHLAWPDLDHEQAVQTRRVTAQSAWKKSVASIVAAWAFRNWRHVVSVWRFGAGGICRALRIRRIVEAPARWPSLSSSPWIRWYPQLKAVRVVKYVFTTEYHWKTLNIIYAHFYHPDIQAE
jgi:hypothetical protein